MRAGGAAAAILVLAAAAASPRPAPSAEHRRDVLAGLEGRYAETHRLRMLDPERTSYLAEDVLEIERSGRRRARLRLTTSFSNGHSCTIEGEARLRGGALVLTERRAGADGRLCRLSVRQWSGRIRWSDGGGSCASYCGTRGSLNGSLPYRSRSTAR